MYTVIESSLLFTLSIITFPIINYISKKSITIEELWIFPIKGCKGYKVNSSIITKRGLKYDRTYMVIDSKMDNKFISQRNYPQMALINTNILLDKELLINSVNHNKELKFSLNNTTNDKIIVTVWGIKCEAYIVSEEASNWFCECLSKEGLKLVKLADDFKRIGEQFDSEVSFADQYPILLASNESLHNINSKLEIKVSMENFRPNIVIKNVNEPFAEDKWKSIQFISNNNNNNNNNKIIMNVPFPPCARCKVPTNDISTGILCPNNQPTKTMSKFRSGDHLKLGIEKLKKHVFFGIHLASSIGNLNDDSIINVGDIIKYTL